MYLLQYFSFSLDVIHLILSYDVLFAQRFHSVNLLGVFLLAKHHLSKGTPSQHLDQGKVLHAHLYRNRSILLLPLVEGG
jgi:hypothetical protein